MVLGALVDAAAGSRKRRLLVRNGGGLRGCSGMIWVSVLFMSESIQLNQLVLEFVRRCQPCHFSLF